MPLGITIAGQNAPLGVLNGAATKVFPAATVWTGQTKANTPFVVLNGNNPYASLIVECDSGPTSPASSAYQVQGSVNGSFWTTISVFNLTQGGGPGSGGLTPSAGNSTLVWGANISGFPFVRLLMTGVPAANSIVTVSLALSMAPIAVPPVGSAQAVSDGQSVFQLFAGNAGSFGSLGVLPVLATNATASNNTMQRTPNVFQGAVAQAGVSTIWQPTVAKKFRLMKYKIEVGEDCTYAAANTPVTLGLTQALGTATGNTLPVLPMLYHRVQVPTVALATAGLLYDSDWIDLGNGFISATASLPLQLGISVAQPTSAITPTFTIASNQWEAATMGFKTLGNGGGARLRQQTNQGVGVGTCVLSGISVLQGNAIIVVVRTKNIAGGVPTVAVTDTLGNTYTALAAVNNASDDGPTNGSSLQIFYTLNMAAGNAANIITVTTSVNIATKTIAVAMEYQGLTAIGTTAQSGATGNSTAPASGSYTPGEAGDLIITAMATGAAGAALASQPTISGFNLRGSIFLANGNLAVADNFGNGTLATGFVNVLCCGTEE